MVNDFSVKELAMIQILSPGWYKVVHNIEVNPPNVLEYVALECFMNNTQGKAVESLRRCIAAIKKCNPYRMTPEYDSLIQL